MIEWRGEAMVLSARSHGETSVILTVFSEDCGRHAGVVRGGMSRKLKPILQPGAQVEVAWSARLESHLGSFSVEPVRSRAVDVMSGRLALEGMNALASLLATATPEREAMPDLYARSQWLADQFGQGEHWLPDYVRWELELLTELGFGLDLTSCAATGGLDELVYVSPKSGRAVSRAGGADWADRLLPLPAFLLSDGEPSLDEVLSGLRLTGYFLANRVAPALGKERLPEARDRFLSVVERRMREEAKNAEI